MESLCLKEYHMLFGMVFVFQHKISKKLSNSFSSDNLLYRKCMTMKKTKDYLQRS